MQARIGTRFLFTMAFAGLALTTAAPATAFDKKAAQAADPLAGEKKPASEKPAALGTWELEYEYQGRSIVDRYELKADDAGKYSGRLLRDGKQVTTLDDIKIDGDKVTFDASGTTEGTDWEVDFEGKVEGDMIEGMVKITVNGQTYDLPWKPKRVTADR